MREVRALVKVDNLASLAAFERAGYARDRRTQIGASEAWDLRYGNAPVGATPGVLFRVDAGSDVGLGHLQRSLSWASALTARDVTCRFLLNEERKRARGSRRPAIPVRSSATCLRGGPPIWAPLSQRREPGQPTS